MPGSAQRTGSRSGCFASNEVMKVPHLNAVIAKTVGATLRTHGYVGGPASFRRSMPEAWTFVAIHRRRMGSASGDPTGLTADLGIASKCLILARGLDPGRPPPRSAWDTEHRLGPLLPGGWDRWWLIEPEMTDAQAAEVLREFADGLIDHALPYIEALANDRALRDSWLADEQYLTPPERQSLMGRDQPGVRQTDR